MQLTRNLLEQLQNRLKIGNRRGVHLNAIPARSRYKFDINRLSHIDKELPKNFINALLTQQPLKFKISWKDNVPDLNTLFEDDQAQLVNITKSLENLINQTEAIESEKGINTFGFGYPLLIRRDQADNKLTVAPILIWSLRIKRTKEFNTWEIKRNEDDPIYINEVLINHLNNDSKVSIDQISSEMMDDGLIGKDDLLDICVNLINTINSSTPENIHEVLTQKMDLVKSIPDKKHYEKLPITSNNSLIDFSGLFSIFEVQKQNIIDDYGNLIELEGLSIDLDDMDDDHSFQPISSIDTDPSQQSILHALESERNILIQGPPGTGKSQSLTAVLVNALENHKKTIVVCEKRTALEVLHNSLNEKGLGDHCVLIKDIVKDRRVAVDSVRERIDKASYNRYYYTASKEPLERAIDKTKSIIESINKHHNKIDEKLLDDKNWTDTIGILLSEYKSNKENFKIEYDKSNFKYTSQEFHELVNVIQEGQRIYDIYKNFENRSFLNPQKLIGDNSFLIEEEIHEDFEAYLTSLKGKKSDIQRILKSNKGNKDLFNYKKTETWYYKLFSIFSKPKSNTLKDQKQLYNLCLKLSERISADGWVSRKINNINSYIIIQEIENIIKSKEDYFNCDENAFLAEYNWVNFCNSLSEDQLKLVQRLKYKKDWRKIFVIYYLDCLLKNFANNNLPLNDEDYKLYNSSLSDIGKEQIKYINQYWFAAQMEAASSFESKHSNLSVANLFNKKSGPKHKRHSLRQIVKYDLDLFSTFFPIILTTPDVCSNLFKGTNKYFDIVLFDEASQLRIEDNLPALLKGKQIIVAGDKHQMPPSNYFSKIFDGTIEDVEDDEEDEIQIDHDDILSTCESLLEFAYELNFNKKYLDFHYRSRHPFLIDFSNHAFYEKRLQPLPNKHEYIPIKYIPVGGTYSTHNNEREAEAVLSLLEHNIHKLSNGEYPSVGIATFNIAQRNLIKSKLIERQKFDQYAEFNEKIIELEEQGLFVKNLENIQGDECDVLILSTTYGVGADGKFAQRFGPINHSKGYKLLNVIITRAKHKIYVCSSVPEEVFLNYKQHLVSGENNRRAVFFAYLAYAKAVSEENEELRQSILNALLENSSEKSNIDIFNPALESPFEEEVYNALLEHFEENKLIPQLQFAGFRIDIVYDPKIKGAPRIAIECDGAAYHSSREAYLHDYYRQKILEEHGFIFHRIWSPNWWRNPKRETETLVDFIKTKSAKIKSSETLSLWNSNLPEHVSFKDDLTHISKIEVNEELGRKEDVEFTEKVTKERPIQTTLYKDIVEANKKIKVRYLNNGKDLIIQIVENKPQVMTSDGVRNVYIKSPLAASILGKSVGDTVKIGDLDNYVEILEVVNA